MTLTIGELKDILDHYPDHYDICGLCVMVLDGHHVVKRLHELQVPCAEDETL